MSVQETTNLQSYVDRAVGRDKIRARVISHAWGKTVEAGAATESLIKSACGILAGYYAGRLNELHVEHFPEGGYMISASLKY